MTSPPPPSPNGPTLVQRVHGDKIRLLFEQSFQGVTSSLVAAFLWVALMWNESPHTNLVFWLAVLCLSATVRLTLFLLYHRHATSENILIWKAPYTITVMLSSLTWGVGTVLVMPDTLLHQAITYVFLVGLAGAALSAYGVFRNMTICIVAAVLLPCTAYFFYLRHATMMLLSLSGVWFFLTTLRAITIHNRTLEESFRRGYELAEAKRIAERQARSDALTGLDNRRAFADAAETLLRVAAREHRPASMLAIDIDNFKHINDGHGHATGDAALKYVARLLTDRLRAADICGRLGGDEFAVLLFDADLDAARGVAEKIRQTLADLPMSIAGGALPFTLSIGIACGPLDVEALLKEADAQMYAAKRQGKNAIASY